MTSIFWFRRDARLDDNPGLAAAAEYGEVVPVFVVDPAFDAVSARRRDLLVAGLAQLDDAIAKRGGRLRVEHGDPAEVIPALAADVAAETVHHAAEVTPYGRRRDAAVAEKVDTTVHEGVYVHPPGSVLTNAGEPYKVFSPFYRSWSELKVDPVPLSDSSRFTDYEGDGLPDFEDPIVPAGADGAADRLEAFLEVINEYKEGRDRLDMEATSSLSVDLKYGWIGPRRLVSEAANSDSAGPFIRQVAWRDFYGHLLADNPAMVDASLDENYQSIEWRNDDEDIEAWKTGQTGYPVVDAAMRQLLETGQMHNRARLIVGSFLVKDLLVDWRVGERFFRHHLIDADVASNSGNWQWVAGTGTDAAPYFRVFNPVTQSRKFDPKGRYIRRWVPELAEVPDEFVHAPWEAGPLELMGYGVELGREYPQPIVDHAMARDRAIETYEAARGSR